MLSKYGLHAESIVWCALKVSPTHARVTSQSASLASKELRTSVRLAGWLFHRRQYCWSILSISNPDPVDPPYRWNTGEHHCYLHNYLAMALIVPRGKQAEPGRSILHRDVLYVFDTSPVSCPTVDVASRNKTFSPSCAKLANLQGRFFARYIPEVQRCHAAGAIFSHRACARDNCARIKKLRDAIVITYRVFLSVFIIFLPPNQWNNRWK